jgi:hypothetical protein
VAEVRRMMIKMFNELKVELKENKQNHFSESHGIVDKKWRRYRKNRMKSNKISLNSEMKPRKLVKYR